MQVTPVEMALAYKDAGANELVLPISPRPWGTAVLTWSGVQQSRSRSPYYRWDQDLDIIGELLAQAGADKVSIGSAAGQTRADQRLPIPLGTFFWSWRSISPAGTWPRSHPMGRKDRAMPSRRQELEAGLGDFAASFDRVAKTAMTWS